MKHLLILLVLSLFNTALSAEQYKGHIIVAGKKISFQIDYTVKKNNLIVGTSLTAKGTSDETQCRIKGKYNKKDKSFYFYETVVLRSKAKYENLNFCLLTAKLKQKKNKSKNVYAGTFTGYVRGTKKSCATGIMYLETKKNRKPKTELIKPKPLIQVDTLISNLKNKKVITYKLPSGKVNLTIWDDAYEDGDRISLYLNGKVVLSNYELKNKKKTVLLKLPSSQKKHFLKIKAINEGKATPNTSRIELQGGGAIKNLRAHIKTDEAVYITIEN